MQLPGGHGVFGNLTVDQNLAVSARLNADGRTQVQQRIANVYDLFPEPRAAASRLPRACRAGSNRCSRSGAC